MFKRTKLSAALLLAFSGTVGSTAVLAQQVLERVEITGSSIKRVDAEGPSPVDVVTRQQIERTGATTINELLRSIAAVDIFDQGELASNSPSGSGTATVRMRGLSETDVLVLLNGRRLPINALHDGSGAGAAVDLNMIPIGAIERIDILKDGASAIYGADAVAGVFNIITRKDYTGAEAYASYGISSRSDGKEWRAGVTAGFGSLAEDKYNLLLTLDRFKRDPIYRKDRDITRSVDFRRFGVGDFRSSFSPFGNYVNASGGLTGEQVRPCPADQFDAAASVCRYDFNASLLTSYNGADRTTGMAVGTVEINPALRLVGEFIYSKSENHFEAHPVPDIFYDPVADAFYRGRFLQGGPRISDRDSSVTHFTLGLEGTAAERYDWAVNFGRGTSRVTNRDSNYYDANLWYPALDSGAIDGTSTTNDPELVESLKVSPLRVGKSVLEFFNAKITGPLMQMPAGELYYAVGMSALNERLVDTPDELTQRGEVVGSIAQAPVDASRSAKAVFAELQIPVLKDLEAQLAWRLDSYRGVGSKASPKVALRYEALPNLAFRASYTESFLAPKLKQQFGATEEGAITITNPTQCAGLGIVGPCDVTAFSVGGSNPDLKPEKGKTYNFGIVYEPTQNTAVGIDLWRIDKSDAISTPTISSAIQQGLFEYDTTATPPRLRIFQNLQNLADQRTQGIDLSLEARFSMGGLGKLSLANKSTYLHSSARKDSPDDGWELFQGTYATPRFRNNLSVTNEIGPWAGTVSAF